MALRNIRTIGDDVLRKKCKKVDNINDRVRTLIKDMFDTMYHAEGVGLAAPQVGILKRIFVVDIGEGPWVFINPEITEVSGCQIDVEGCLSIPNEQGEVERPNIVKVKAINEKGEEFTVVAEGFFARAICHENDHLDGVLYVDKLNNKES